MRTRERALVALIAIVAPVVVWVVARLAGVDIESVRRSERAVDLPAHYVAIVAAVFTLGGWALLALLERWLPRRAHVVWTVLAVGMLGVVLVHTALESKLTGGQRLVLALMAVAVAGVAVPLLPRGLRRASRTDSFTASS